MTKRRLVPNGSWSPYRCKLTDGKQEETDSKWIEFTLVYIYTQELKVNNRRMVPNGSWSPHRCKITDGEKDENDSTWIEFTLV